MKLRDGEEILDTEIDGISSASELFNAERDIRRAAKWAKHALGFAPVDYRDEPEVSETNAGKVILDGD
jgi:hypothetical protein